jgi:hypothetical protein
LDHFLQKIEKQVLTFLGKRPNPPHQFVQMKFIAKAFLQVLLVAQAVSYGGSYETSKNRYGKVVTLTGY